MIKQMVPNVKLECIVCRETAVAQQFVQMVMEATFR